MASAPTASSRSGGEPPLVGRADQLGLLRDLAGQARAGRGSLVLLRGEAGIGKTRLATELVRHAEAQGFATRWATCWDGEGVPAYWPWGRLLTAHADAVDDDILADDVGTAAGPVTTVVPELAARLPVSSVAAVDEGLDQAQQRFRLFDAVTSVFRRAAGRQPVVLVIDDLHDADAESLRLLAFVAREVGTMSLLVVTCHRPAEVATGSARAALLAAIAGHVVDLPPLGVDDVARLLASLAYRAPAPTTAAAVTDRTTGNPLFVLELGRQLATSRDEPTAMVATVPPGIRMVVDRRLQRLAPTGRDLLEVAAVAGLEIEPGLLEAATGVARLQVLESLDEAVQAEVVRAGEDGCLAFAHPLLREAIYSRLSPARRAERHGSVAAALEAAGGADRSPATLAYHALRAGPHADPANVVAWCRLAGQQALRRFAHEDAADHFQRALDAHTSGDPAVALDLWLLLGDAQVGAGNLPAARAAFEEAAVLARRRGNPEELARAALGLGAGLSGFEVQLFDRAQVDLLEEALAALGTGHPGLRTWCLARLSVALAFVASDERRQALSDEAVRLGREVGDTAALAYALASRCDALAGPDHVERRLADASEIIDLAVVAGQLGTELLGRRLRVVALLELGDIAAVDAEIDAYERTARELRSPLYLWYVPHWRAMRALMRGHLDQCERLVAEAEAIGQRAHSDNAAVTTASQRLAVATARHDPAGAAAALDQVDETYAAETTVNEFRVNLLARQGRAAEARIGLAHVIARGPAAGHEDGQWLAGRCQLAEAAATLGDRDAAASLYEVLRPYAGRFVVDATGSVWLGAVALYLGLLDHAVGDPTGAVAHLEHARDAHRAAGAPLLVAATLHAHANVIADVDAAGAAALRREAGAIEQELGVAGDRPASVAATPAPPVDNLFRREGEYWTLAFDGTVARVKDSKGMRDIAALLATPGTEIHVLDLLTHGAAPPEGDSGEVLDAAATRAYRARLTDLEKEVDDAEAANDPERAAKAREERDALVTELTRAYGLGGRARGMGDRAERARSAVSWRVRHALRRIDEAHPVLARHLDNSLRTGRFCSYQPEGPVDWSL